MSRRSTNRDQLLAELFQAGREFSTATVLFHSAIAARVGLNATDEKTLDILDRFGPLTAGEIASRTGLTTGTVTNLIDRLETKRFVRRIRSDRDRRSVIVEIVPEGAAAFVPLFQSFSEAVMELYQSYSDDELATILDFLKKMASVAREEMHKLEQSAASTR